MDGLVILKRYFYCKQSIVAVSRLQYVKLNSIDRNNH